MDDALALLVALGSEGVEIVGIGASCGNVGARRSALNALRTLDAAGVRPDFPVCVGMEAPLGGWPPGDLADAQHVHGPGGLGRTDQPDPDPARLSDQHAVDLIIETYRQPSDVTLVVTGPLTNVARALRVAWEIERNIPRIVWMGGAFQVPGNVAPCAEFNAWMDPVAAAEVLSSSVPMTVVGLDVTMHCHLLRDDIHRRLDPETRRLGRYILDITRHCMDFGGESDGFDGCTMHDPLALAVALKPDLVRTLPYHVQVITDDGSPVRGMTVIDRRPRGGRSKGPLKDIALEVDSAAFGSLLMECLDRVSRRAEGHQT